MCIEFTHKSLSPLKVLFLSDVVTNFLGSLCYALCVL